MKCKKCKADIEKVSKFCPNCGTKVKHIGRQVVAVILILAVIAGGVGFAGWKFGLLPFKNTDAAISTEGIALLTDSFTDRKITDQDSALAAIGDVADILGIEDVNAEFSECKVNTVSGNTYYRFQQSYQGIPVYGRCLIATADGGGNSLSLSGNYFDVSGLSTSPKIDEAAAIKAAREHYGEDATIISEGLVIYSFQDQMPELAWKLTAGYSLEVECCFISSETGSILSTERLCEALLETNQMVMDEAGIGYIVQGNGRLSLVDDRHNITAVSLSQEAYNDADAEVAQLPVVTCDEKEVCGAQVETLKNLVTAYQFYMNTLNRHSFDGKGGLIYLIFLDRDINYEQASGNGHEEVGCLLVGTANKIFSRPLGCALDIIGHEYTHMISHKILDFVPSAQTNAIDEGLADIFGNLIEVETYGNSERVWNLGEDAGYSKYSMADQISMDSYDSTTTDGHGNAAIISHAAYLMSTGVTDASNLQALTTEDIAHLFYETLYTLPSDCTFSQFRSLTQNMAKIMCEQGRLTQEQVQCVSAAFFEVGIMPVTMPVAKELNLDVYDMYGQLYENYTLYVRHHSGAEKKYAGETVASEGISFPTTGTYELVVEDNANADNRTTFTVQAVDHGGTKKIPVFTHCGLSKIDGPITAPSSDSATPLESYMEAANRTTSNGSWTEDVNMTASMVLKKGSSTTKTKAKMEASVDIEGWNGTDTSSLYMSGSASMSVLNQAIAYTMTWQNGTAHYEYTKPSVTSADLKIDPSYFDLYSLTEDMIISSTMNGNQITLFVQGDALTKAGISAVNSLLSGVENLSYDDAKVNVTVNAQSGKIDTLTMDFHASMTYQGYDAEVDYEIQYEFSEHGGAEKAKNIIP